MRRKDANKLEKVVAHRSFVLQDVAVSWSTISASCCSEKRDWFAVSGNGTRAARRKYRSMEGVLLDVYFVRTTAEKYGGGARQVGVDL